MMKRFLFAIWVFLLVGIHAAVARNKGNAAKDADEPNPVNALYDVAANDKMPLLARTGAVDALGKWRAKDQKVTATGKRDLLKRLINALGRWKSSIMMTTPSFS